MRTDAGFGQVLAIRTDMVSLASKGIMLLPIGFQHIFFSGCHLPQKILRATIVIIRRALIRTICLSEHTATTWPIVMQKEEHDVAKMFPPTSSPLPMLKKSDMQKPMASL